MKDKILDNLCNAVYVLEDYNLFQKVQIAKYISNKNTPLSKDSPEWDMVVELIKDYWCDLLASGYINNKNKKEKELIFQSVEIIFPYITIPVAWLDGVTYVDFKSFSK